MATVETQSEAVPPRGSVYDGFISYSHAADELLAPRLQAGLQRFAKPWWKRRALRIFRDEAALAANPHLWGSIIEAMGDSDWLVLLLSPKAAASEWVNREVEWWLEHQNPGRIIPVVTDGEFAWGDRDLDGDAVPPALRGTFSDEPRWVDLRFARTEEQVDLKNPQFSAAVADIASAIRGIPKDELASEEVRQHRRTVRTAWAAAIALLALVVVAGAAAVYANGQRITAEANEAEANAQREIAEQQTAAAEQQRARAEQLAREARADALAATSIAQLDVDPELSLLLALESLALDGQTGGLNAIQNALQAHRAVFEVAAPPSGVPLGSGATGGLSPDGEVIVVAGHGPTVEAWEVGGTVPLWTWDTPLESSVVLSPRFTTDGGSVLVVATPAAAYDPFRDVNEYDDVMGEDTIDRLFVLDAASGEELRSIDIPACPWMMGTVPMPPHVDLSLPIPWAVCSESPQRARVGLLDPDDGSFVEIATVVADGSGVPTIDAKARYFAYASGGPGRVIDLSTGERVHDYQSGLSTLSADGGAVLTGDGLSDLESGAQLWELDEYMMRGWFGGDGELVYTTSFGGGASVLDARTGETLLVLVGQEGGLWETAMAVNGRRLATFSRAGSARVWDLSPVLSHGPVYATSVQLRSHPPRGSSVAGGHAAVWVGEAAPTELPWRISIFDLATGETVRSVEGGAPALSPDGELLAYRSAQREGNAVRVGPIRIVEVGSGELVLEIGVGCEQILTPDDVVLTADCELPNGSLQWELEFSPDGTLLAMVDGHDLSTIWDVSSGELVFEQDFPAGIPTSIAFTKDQRQVVITDAFERVRAYNLESAALQGSVASEDATGFLDAGFAPDGSLLYVSTSGGDIVVIDPLTWATIETFNAHRGSAVDLAVNQSGSRLASTGADGYVRLWDAGDRSLITEIEFGVDEITNVEFIDDTHLLVTPGVGTEAVVITLDPDELVAVARSRLTRSFTAEECDRFGIDPCPSLVEIKGG